MSVRTHWFRPIAVSTGTLMLLYCVLVLGYVATSPDVRVRALLAEAEGDAEISPAPSGRPTGILVRLSASETGLEVYPNAFSPNENDRLLYLDDTPVHSFLDYVTILQRLRVSREEESLLKPGEDASKLENLLPPQIVDDNGNRYVRAEFYRAEESSTHRTWLKVQSVPLSNVLLTFVWFFLQTGIIALSALSVWHRPADRGAQLFFCMCLLTLGAFVGAFHWWVVVARPWLDLPFTICALLVPAVSVHFFLTYPEPVPLMKSHRTLCTLGVYLIPTGACLAFVAALTAGYWFNGYWLGNPTAASSGNVEAVTRIFRLLRDWIYAYILFAGGCFVLILGALWRGIRTTQNPLERGQMKLMMWAAAIAAIPIGYAIRLAVIDRAEFALQGARIPMFVASVSFMLAYVIGIARFKMMLLDEFVSRGMMYWVASAGLTLFFGATVSATSLFAAFHNQTLSPQQSMMLAATLVLVILVMLWMRDRIQYVIDRRFYRQKYQLDKAMQRVGRATGHIEDRQSVAERMVATCREVLHAEIVGFYVRDPGRPTFQLMSVHGGRDLPVQFSATDDLMVALRRDSLLQRSILARKAGNEHLTEPFRSLHAEILFALEADGEVLAFVSVGAGAKGAAYTAEDLTFLNALGQITCVALQTAAMTQNLERLNEEMKSRADKIEEQKRQIALLEAEAIADQPRSAKTLSDTEYTEFQRETIKGNSPAIQRVFATVRKVAGSESTVLINGASGTGKELLAQAIHDNSRRRENPMVRVHCAALSPSLLESELFGHVKGAFTGAHRDRVGRFEMANGGTLFLDEIGDISLETQVKLLRVLQTRTFEPVGGTRSVTVDVRLVTATHQDLPKLIREGRFREDLYYRLNVVAITLPELRERQEDIVELSLHFLRQASKRQNKRITNIQEDAVKALKAYHWPGNIRELENTIERAVVLADGNSISVSDLPAEIVADSIKSGRKRAAGYQANPISWNPETESVVPNSSTNAADSGTANPDGTELQRNTAVPVATASIDRNAGERETLLAALEKAGGVKAKAARLLGMPRSTYYSKLKKYGID